METSKLFPWILGFLGASVALLSPAMSRRAHAFGGLSSSPDGSVTQSAVQIVFVDTPDATVTAVVRFEYVGSAEAFAWLIPVRGVPLVGMSSSTVFQRLQAATAPEYWIEVGPEGPCAEPHYPEPAFDSGAGTGGTSGILDAQAPSVAVNEQGSVGPYDYVNIAVDASRDDPTRAVTDWLTANGYDASRFDRSALGAYLRDGLNLLVFKLAKGGDPGAIRPVMLTYESELPTIPLRLAAAAAPQNMAVQVWVFGPSQAVPDNYKSLVLNDARIDWLSGQSFPAGTLPGGGAGPFGPSARKPGNYDAVVSAAANEAGGQGFVTELGGPASQYRDKIWSSSDDETFATVSSQSYEDGIDALLNAYSQYGGWDGWRDAVEGATTLPAGVTIDQFGRDPAAYRGEAEVDTARFFELLSERVVKPVADTAALFYGAPYLTRLYTTLSADEMTVDPAFNYNADLDQVSKVHVARQFVECGADPSDAQWRIELPQGGVIVGSGSGWPVTDDSMPANLKIVMLTTSGSGKIVEDNSEEIGTALLEAAGTLGSRKAFKPPEHGVAIGGMQTVIPYEEPEPADDGAKSSTGSECSVARPGADGGRTLATYSPLAALIFVRCRRRSRSERRRTAS